MSENLRLNTPKVCLSESSYKLYYNNGFLSISINNANIFGFSLFSHKNN